MPRPALKAVPQLGMDEQTINDPEIEAALDERQKRKGSLDAVRLSYDDADERAKALCARLELPDGHAVRVGQYRITRVHNKAASVSFERKASSHIQIALLED